MSLLDTVEPDAFLLRGGIGPDGEIADDVLIDLPEGKGWDTALPLYSRETVESLLPQCRKEARKEALLEAAEFIRPKPVFCAMTTETLHATSALHRAADELRRMAEGEKHE